MKFCEHVKIREEKFGAVIFETLREKIFVTNSSGKEILRLLSQGHSLDEIVETLADSYQVPASLIREDVIEFVNQLQEQGILPP